MRCTAAGNPHRDPRPGLPHVIAVKTDHRVSTPAGTSTVTDLVKRMPARSWQRLRTGSGTKGATCPELQGEQRREPPARDVGRSRPHDSQPACLRPQTLT